MDINVFDDRKNKSATIRILADCPSMEKLIEAVLYPRFSRVEKGAFLTIVCLEGACPDIVGPCVFVGCRPRALSDGQVCMERPLDIEGFFNTCVDIFEKSTVRESGWSFDPVRGTAALGGREVTLTAREGELFLMLLSHIGECVSREDMDTLLWNGEVSGNCADVYVCYLRKKLEKIAGPGMLISVRGRGYMLKKP